MSHRHVNCGLHRLYRQLRVYTVCALIYIIITAVVDCTVAT